MSTSVPTTSESNGRAGHRQMLTPLGTSWLRKDRDAPEVPPLVPLPRATILSPRPPPPTKATRSEPKSALNLPPAKPKPRVNNGNDTNNLVLAGYLAHEYLTRGTIMGQAWNPRAAKKGEVGEREEKRRRIYADTGNLVMGESGIHIPGIVNPTELASWLQQKQ